MEHLKNRQIAFLLFGIIAGFGALTLPKDAAAIGGTGGWVWIAIFTILVAVYTYMVSYIGKMHPNKTFFEYSQLLVGKWIAFIFIILLIGYYMGFFIVGVRMATQAIKLTILLKTPIWALSLLFYAVVYYAVTKKLIGIARLCELYGIIIIISTLFNHILMFTQGNMLYIRPAFTPINLNIIDFGNLSNILFALLGFEILFIVPMKENNKKLYFYTIPTILFIGGLYIFVVESCISIMGVDAIVYYKDALFTAIRRLDVPMLQIFRRLDGIFLVTWTMSILCTNAIVAYAIIFLLNKFFKKISFNLIAFFVVLFAFIATQYFKTMDQIENFKSIISIFGIGYIFTMPLLLFIITKVKYYGKKKS